MFKTSNNPYANPQRKNKIVTKKRGKIDSLRVISLFPVATLSETTFFVDFLIAIAKVFRVVESTVKNKPF